MRRLALATLLAAAFATRAGANGRPAGTSSIQFRQGNPADIVAGLTFGLVVSHDGGATWHWMCEAAVGYAGMYDPVYAYSQSGAIFATTFDGLKVNRDTCNFDATPPGNTFISQVYLGPDHAVYYTAADSDVGDSKIYKSTDDGMTFPQSAAPGMSGDWWESIVAAPSDASRVYVSGYRFQSGGQPKIYLMFQSTDGGATFNPLPVTDFTTSNNSKIDLAGISPTSPDVLFAIVTQENGTIGDALYRSTDAGATWTKLLSKGDSLHFLVRSDGSCVLGTQTLGAWTSTDCADPNTATPTWTALPSPPHINCLVENSQGEVWACTQNFGQPGGIQSDGYGIMKSTDLQTWTGVLKFQDIAGPVDCAAGTVQHDTCQETVWCGLKQQLGITSNAIDCPSATADSVPSVDAGTGTKPPKGCCDTSGAGGPATLVLGLFVALVLVRPRRAARS